MLTVLDLGVMQGHASTSDKQICGLYDLGVFSNLNDSTIWRGTGMHILSYGGIFLSF